MSHRLVVVCALVLTTVGGFSSVAADVVEHEVEWVGGASNWGAPTNWDLGVIPDNDPESDPEDVYLVTIEGGGAIVQLDLNVTISTLGLLSNAVLDVTDGDLTLVDDSGLLNEGTLTVTGRTLTMGGGCSNHALLRLDDGGQLIFNAHPSELLEDGTLRLMGGAARLRTAGGVVLTNSGDHTIEGSGEILANLVNMGTIDANVPGSTLTLRTFQKQNAGGIYVRSGAELSIECSLTNTSDGGIVCESGGTLQVDGGSIEGGTVMVTNGGALLLLNGAEVDCDVELEGATSTGTVSGTGNELRGYLANAGLFEVVAGASLVSVGTYHNSLGGEIVVGDGAPATTVNVLGALALTGQGMLTLGGSGARIINGSVTNGSDHTIAGVGEIASILTNDGVVRADVADGTLQLIGALKTNNTTMEAIDDGTLEIQAALVNVNILSGTAGTIIVGSGGFVSGGVVELTDSSILKLESGRVTGAEVTIDATSSVRVTQTDNELSSTVNIEEDIESETHGVIDVMEGADLEVWGTYNNNGAIKLAVSRGAPTTLSATADLALNETGELVLGGANTEVRTIGTASISNGLNHTIRGAGTISGNLENHGDIVADVVGGELRFVGASMMNFSTISAEPGAQLTIVESTANNQASGRVEVKSAALRLEDLGVLTGGTVDVLDSTVTMNRGQVTDGIVSLVNTSVTVEGSDNVLAGSIDMDRDTTVTIGDGATMFAGGTFANRGVVNLAAGGSVTSLFARPEGLTLTGTGGRLHLDGANARVGVGGAIVNDTGHIIDGAGTVSAALTNGGIISANMSDGILELADGTKLNEAGAELLAEGGGELRIAVDVTGEGDWLADGGTISIKNEASVFTTGLIRARNTGRLQVDADSTLGGNYLQIGIANV